MSLVSFRPVLFAALVLLSSWTSNSVAQATAATRAAETAEAEAPPPLQAMLRTHRSRFNVPAENAADIAQAVLPYAALATEVYCYLRSDESRPFQQRRDETCPDAALHRQHRWQRAVVYPTDRLPPKDRSDRGLRMAVYFQDKGPAQPVNLALAFRGTEFDSWSDWHSNLHWFLPGRDQYHVLREIAHQVIDDSKAKVQQRLGRAVQQWQIVTTGHSLGGGLAQLVAYKNREVAAAVVFDSSPVTGYYTCVEDAEVNCNVPVWRVYARGEVLAYARALLRKGYSLSENITEVEFDGVEGNLIHKHSMTAFYKLLDRARGHVPSPAWQAGGLFAPTSDCHCIAQRENAGWQQHQARCAEVWATLAPGTADWHRAREDALLAAQLQQRLQRLPPPVAATGEPASLRVGQLR